MRAEKARGEQGRDVGRALYASRSVEPWTWRKAVLMPLVIALMISFVSMEALPSEARLRAIDGDTLAPGPERIRVVGLDAPEMPTHAARDALGLPLATSSRRRWTLLAR